MAPQCGPTVTYKNEQTITYIYLIFYRFTYTYLKAETVEVEATLTSHETHIISTVISIQEQIGGLTLTGPEAIPIHGLVFIRMEMHKLRWSSKCRNFIPCKKRGCWYHWIFGFLEFLVRLVYQPKSLVRSCFVRRVSSSCLIIGVGIGVIICTHLPLPQD